MPFFQPDVMADMTTQQQSEWLLEMIDVSKSFPGVKALDKVNLRVRPHSVHALMGENGAGKSTLLKCLFGIYEKDQGKIFFKGQEINFTSSKEALENGVSMVHQELNLVLQRTVMDNMWLGRYPTKGWFIDHGKMYDDTKRIFDELDIDIDSYQPDPTLLGAGRLIVGSDSALGVGTLRATNNSTLDASTAVTLGNAVDIVGNLHIGGSATLLLSLLQQRDHRGRGIMAFKLDVDFQFVGT
mgnify:CR=1 FL=1